MFSLLFPLSLFLFTVSIQFIVIPVDLFYLRLLLADEYTNYHTMLPGIMFATVPNIVNDQLENQWQDSYGTNQFCKYWPILYFPLYSLSTLTWLGPVIFSLSCFRGRFVLFHIFAFYPPHGIYEGGEFRITHRIPYVNSMGEQVFLSHFSMCASFVVVFFSNSCNKYTQVNWKCF